MRRRTISECPAVLDPEDSEGADETREAIAHFTAEGPKEKFPFRAYAHQDVRKALTQAFEGLCAYCEDQISAIEIEHYRPKGAIRTEGGKLEHGYYWLAACWDNLLAACYYCNTVRWKEDVDGRWVSSGKGSWFPLEDEAARATCKGEEEREQPLLLNPYKDDPAEHLDFGSDGVVRPRTRRGAETIRILGLNRHGLPQRRRLQLVLLGHAIEDARAAQRAWRAGEDDEQLAAAYERRVRDLEQFLDPREHGYTGAIAQHLGLTQLARAGVR